MTIRIPIISEWQGKGVKDAQKQISAFDKSVKRLGSTFATVFGARQIARFTKNAIMAFVQEDKAVQALAVNLRNLGLAYDVRPIEAYIDQIERATGVAGTDLREALQLLASSTMDLAMSQNLLNLAMDVSAGTGKSLRQVAQALSRAYLGTNTSLQRLNIGLSKADLATKNFDEIVDELSKRFTGQAAAAAGTYAGQIAILTEAAGKAQEILGEKLVKSVEKLTDPQKGIPALADGFEKLAEDVGNVALGLSTIISNIKALRDLIPSGANSWLDKFRDATIGIFFPQVGAVRGVRDIGRQEAEKEAELEATRLRDAQRYEALYQKLYKVKKKVKTETTDEVKSEKEKLKLARQMFEDDRISIAAALKNESLDRNEILRLELKRAILNENADKAESLAKKLQESQTELTKLANFKPANPFQEWIDSLDQMQRQLSAFNVSPSFLAQSSTADAAASMISMGTKTNNDAILESGVNLLNGWIFSGLMASGQAELDSLMAEQQARESEMAALSAARAAGVSNININVTGTGGLDDQTKKAVVDAVVEASSLGYGTGWFRTTGAYTI